MLNLEFKAFMFKDKVNKLFSHVADHIETMVFNDLAQKESLETKKSFLARLFQTHSAQEELVGIRVAVLPKFDDNYFVAKI